MRQQTPHQLAVCSWSLQAGGPADLVAKVNGTGLKRVQLGLTPHREDAGAWDGVQGMLADAGMQVVSGMFATVGEDYTTLETIRRTGGIVPDEHWDMNLERAGAAADLARSMKLSLVSTHVGFLPHDQTSGAFETFCDRLTRIARLFDDHGLVLLMETGQETARDLLAFLEMLQQRGIANVGVNFDPANMLLYGMGDPIDALGMLMPWIRQVHLKDARPPTVPGTWGAEAVVGSGDVDWGAFLRTLAEHDYAGDMAFEREAGDDRVGDIRMGAESMTAMMRRLPRGAGH